MTTGLPNSSKGKEMAVDAGVMVNNVTIQSRTALTPTVSLPSTIASVTTGSQTHATLVPRTQTQTHTRHAFLLESSLGSRTIIQSLPALPRTPTQIYSGHAPLPSLRSSSSSTPQVFPSTFSNRMNLPPERPLVDMSAGYTPQSVGQHVTSLLRYIQDTMYEIGCATNQLKAISRRSWESERVFPAFSSLPLEIQLMIWEYAVPNARKISNSIMVIVNHDLNDPKAILPKPKEYKKIYGDIFARTIQAAADEGQDMERDPYDFRWDVNKHMVFSMMQTCHNARVAVMKRFCLDVEYPKPNAGSKLLWSEDDILYFPCLGFSFERRMAMQWLSRKHEAPPPSLARVQNIALPLERILLQSFGINPVFLGRNSVRYQWDNDWLKNLPNLKTFGLYLDPGDVSEKEEGELRLYEPEDVPVFYCSHYTPTDAEKAVKNKLNEFRETERSELTAEASVLCWKRPKWNAQKAASTLLTPPLGLGPRGVSLVLKPAMEESESLLQLTNAEVSGGQHHQQLLRQLQEHLSAHPCIERV